MAGLGVVGTLAVTGAAAQQGPGTRDGVDVATPAAPEPIALEQCANGPAPSSSSDGCTEPGDWVGADVGAARATYLEGESIPYRLVLRDLPTGVEHTATIEWETLRDGVHTLDALTSPDRTVRSAAACAGLDGCANDPVQAALPADPQLAAAGVAAPEGALQAHGATVSGIGPLTYPDGAGFAGRRNARLTISFVPSGPLTVLAWGARIASRQDWGAAGTALALGGNPYRLSLVELDGAAHRRSATLTAGAVVYPASISVTHLADVARAVPVAYEAAPAPLDAFSLTDDGAAVPQGPATRTFSGITQFTDYTIRQLADDRWSPTGVTCEVDSRNGGRQHTGTAEVTIELAEGEAVRCTFANRTRLGTLLLRSEVHNDAGGTATPAAVGLVATGPTAVRGQGTAGGDVVAGVYELAVEAPDGYDAGPWRCEGADAAPSPGSVVSVAARATTTCTVALEDRAAHVVLVRERAADDAGVPDSEFVLGIDGPTSASAPAGVDTDVLPGRYRLTAAAPQGYLPQAWRCEGGTLQGDTLTVALGEQVRCAVTFNDKLGDLALSAQVRNEHGGRATDQDVTVRAVGPTPLSGSGATDGSVNPGTYALSVELPTGYRVRDWSCEGADLDGAVLTIAARQTVRCTVVVQDVPAVLVLERRVRNDNGGTAADTDVRLTLVGPVTATGAGRLELEGPGGEYRIGEEIPAGYRPIAWDCTGAMLDGSTLHVPLGAVASCTGTVDDVAPQLHLRTTITNDDGGTRTAEQFEVRAERTDGDADQDVRGPGTADSTPGLRSGSWTLSAGTAPGYDTAPWSCVGAGGSPGPTSTIRLGIGEEVTCTVIFDDQPATVVVKATAVGAAPGAAAAFGFVTSGDGYAAFELDANREDRQRLDAGSYTVRPVDDAGWVLTGVGGATDAGPPYRCAQSGPNGSVGVGNAGAASIALELRNGDTVTCTFEHTAIGAVRTQQFWSTHPQLAEAAWFGRTAFGRAFPGVATRPGLGNRDLCGRTIDDPGKLLGAFWALIGTKTNGTRRDTLGVNRIQLLPELLAAELNAAAFAAVPAGGIAVFAQWEGTYCGSVSTAIRSVAGAAAAFNGQGDSPASSPGMSTDAATARAVANIGFWDVLA